MAKPFLRWVGGKRQLLPELMKRVPRDFGQYHEPFLGGGAFFFALKESGHLRGREHFLGDANPDLVNTYTCVRDNVEVVVDVLRTLGQSADRDSYVNARAAFNQNKRTDGDTASAAFFIYLNRMGFNGLCRYSRKGVFNTPYGDGRFRFTEDYYENLRACSRALEVTPIYCGGYDTCDYRYHSGDFIYLDPPYAPVSATANFTGYTPTGADEIFQEQLAHWAVSRTRCDGAKVLASNADVPLVHRLWGDDSTPLVHWVTEKGFSLEPVRARRAINCKGNGRGPVGELLMDSLYSRRTNAEGPCTLTA